MVTKESLAEIAEAAMSYLYDNDLLDDFLEDRSIDLTEDDIARFFPFGELDETFVELDEEEYE